APAQRCSAASSARPPYPALDGAELERRPLYQMRHTYATLALAAGARIEWVSRQMGHRDIRTTLRFYARFVPEVDARNLAALDAFADARAKAEARSTPQLEAILREFHPDLLCLG